jgi:ubiquinone/menaquinone biosynthesis C-methylase UbiE
MPDDVDPRKPPTDPAPPMPSDFDEGYTASAASDGLRRLWQAAEPDLPVEIEPFSFLSVGLLDHLSRTLALSSGQLLVDLACGRGGPGLWLARAAGASLIGVDFSAVAVEQATARAGLFGLSDRARFVVGDLTATGLPDATADAAVCVDAMHFPAEPAAAVAEAARILRPGGRLVLTNWQPRDPQDSRLPPRLRHRAWSSILDQAGFADVRVEARPEWHDVFTRVYRTALDAGDPAGDTGLADLQEEARRRLDTADLVDRVVASGTRP